MEYVVHITMKNLQKTFCEKVLKDNLIDHCLSVEGNCALHVKNDKPHRAINFGKNKNS